MTVGSYGGPGISGEYFNGQIDDVRIYNRTLSQNEISQIYSSSWKNRPIVFVNISGTWQRVKEINVNVSGSWRAFNNIVV
jgi:ribonuclease I